MSVRSGQGTHVTLRSAPYPRICRSAPTGAPPAAAPAATEAPKVVTVHDLFSDAPVVAEAPAGDGGMQSLQWSEATLTDDADGDRAHSFIVCETPRSAGRVASAEDGGI